jgi:hypothetical protein
MPLKVDPAPQARREPLPYATPLTPSVCGSGCGTISIVGAVAQAPWLVIMIVVSLDHFAGRPVRLVSDTIWYLFAFAPALCSFASGILGVARRCAAKDRNRALVGLSLATLWMLWMVRAWWEEIWRAAPGAIHPAL